MAELLAVLLFANLARIPTVDLCLPNCVQHQRGYEEEYCPRQNGGLKLTVLQCIDKEMFAGYSACMEFDLLLLLLLLFLLLCVVVCPCQQPDLAQKQVWVPSKCNGKHC